MYFVCWLSSSILRNKLIICFGFFFYAIYSIRLNICESCIYWKAAHNQLEFYKFIFCVNQTHYFITINANIFWRKSHQKKREKKNFIACAWIGMFKLDCVYTHSTWKKTKEKKKQRIKECEIRFVYLHSNLIDTKCVVWRQWVRWE